MSTLAEKLKFNQKQSEERSRQMSSRLEIYEQQKKKELIVALSNWFEKAKQSIIEQIEQGNLDYCVSVNFDISNNYYSTEEVEEFFQFSRNKKDFFPYAIEHFHEYDDYAQEFLKFYDWALDEGIEPYWYFETDYSSEQDDMLNYKGTYQLKIKMVK